MDCGKVRILIGGDFVPTQTNKELFDNKDVMTLFGEECVQLFKSADYSIINLEAPLVDKETPIQKWGVNLFAPTSSKDVIKKLGINLVGLSNNHILDQGRKGLNSTIDILTQSGISYVGAGKDINSATQVMIKNIKGKRIGVYACCEHEFNFATLHKAGANPFDPLESLDHIIKAREKCDYLIVLFHGGIEYYRYPSPQIKKICHKMVEKGADLVVMQHSHCVGCHEKYINGEILYGQGNFLFDRGNDEYWATGLLIMVEIGSDTSIKYIPLEKMDNCVRVSQNEDIIKNFENRSKLLNDDDILYKNYSQMADERLNTYLEKVGGKLTNNILFRGFNKLLKRKLIYNNFRTQELLCLIDYLRCEAHNELIDAGCVKRLSELNKR